MGFLTKMENKATAMAKAESPPLPPGGNGGWYELRIPARVEAVGPLCAFLTILAERLGLTAEDIRSLEISTYETCLNVIEHAYDFDPRGRIVFRVRADAEKIVLSFYDRGKGVDPRSVPPPDVSDPLVRMRGRGFGLQIIRNSVDVMRYRKTATGENNLLLVKNLSRNRDEEPDAEEILCQGGSRE